MQYSFKNIGITLNNNYFCINDLKLSNNIELTPRYTTNSRYGNDLKPAKMWAGTLAISYYLTGYDYLKQFIISNEYSLISGNIGGITFGQGYLSSYSAKFEPNSPVQINANINFYDSCSGGLTSSSLKFVTGSILKTSDVIINNYSNYSQNIINNLLNASFNYSCELEPSYSYFDTGSILYQADHVFIKNRSISTEISCDGTGLNLPLSGEKFSLNLIASSPYNTGNYETFTCSGLISEKNININTNSPHYQTFKIAQYDENKIGYISSVQSYSNQIFVNFASGPSSLFSTDGSINYIDKIFIGDTEITGYYANRPAGYDQIVAPIPYNAINDVVTVYTSQGTYVYPQKISLAYSPMVVSGFYPTTGLVGSTILISGSNFNRVTDVFFGNNIPSVFTMSGQTIQAIVPVNCTDNYIVVNSYLKGISGVSSSKFYCPPNITAITPLTGSPQQKLSVTGNNLTNVYSVYFNNGASVAYNQQILGDNQMNIYVPDVGNPFPSGYIKFNSLGGSSLSPLPFDPRSTINSFSPTSGQPNLLPFVAQQITITMNGVIDSNYLYPFRSYTANSNFYGGTIIPNLYTFKVGGQFLGFNFAGTSAGNTIMTGLLLQNYPNQPFYNDYISVLNPDGVTLSPTNQIFSINNIPNIVYSSPTIVNAFKSFNLFIKGSNFSAYGTTTITFSGGVNNDNQSFSVSPQYLSSDYTTVLLNGITLTGSSGLYNLTLNNGIGSYTLNNAITVEPPFDQASYGTAAYFSLDSIQGDYNAQPSLLFSTSPALSMINGQNPQSGNVAVVCYPNLSKTGSIVIYPQSVPYFNVSSLSINTDLNPPTASPAQTSSVPNSYYFNQIVSGMPSPSGYVILYTGTITTSNLTTAKQAWRSPMTFMSGANIIIGSMITGVTAVRICSATGMGAGRQFLPLTQVQIF